MCWFFIRVQELINDRENEITFLDLAAPRPLVHTVLATVIEREDVHGIDSCMTGPLLAASRRRQHSLHSSGSGGGRSGTGED